MSKNEKNKIFNFNRTEQVSTLELWQLHLQALKRASKERHNVDKNGSSLDSNEIPTSETDLRTPQ